VYLAISVIGVWDLWSSESHAVLIIVGSAGAVV